MFREIWADSKKRNLFIILMALVVIVIVLASLLVVNIIKNQDDVGTDSGAITDEKDIIDDKILEAITRFSQYQSLDELIHYTNIQLANAKTDEEKAAIYIDRAREFYFRMKNSDVDLSKEVLSDSYEAEKIYPTSESAWRIYMYENAFGSKEKAEEYLEISKERGHKLGGG